MIDPNDPRIIMFKIKALQMGQPPEAVDAFIQQQIGDVNTESASQQLGLQKSQLDLQQEQIALQEAQRTPDELGLAAAQQEIAKQKAIKDAGLDKGTEDEQNAIKKKENYGRAATNLIRVLDAGEKGTLKGKAYEDALNFAASKMAESTFETGGKQLTEMEQALLQGSRPTIQIKGANIFQKALGIVPPQTARVLDDPATLRRKAIAAQSYARGEDISPELLDNIQKIQSKGSDKSLLANAGSDTKNILNGLLNIPKASLDYSRSRAEKFNSGQANALMPQSIMTDLLFKTGRGVVGEYNELLGEPLKGGDVVDRIVTRAKEKPVTTALDILPILGVAKKMRRTTAAEGGVASKAPVVEENFIQRAGSDLRAKVAKPKVKADPYYARNVDDLVKTQSELGLTGNASNQLKQLPQKMDALDAQLKSSLVKKSIPEKTTVSSIQKWADRVDYLGEEATFIKEMKKLEARRIKAGTDAEKIYSFKSEIAGEMDSVFKKLDRGEDLTPKQAAKVSYWNGLKDAIDTVSPEVRRVNTLQNKAYRLSPGLVANQGKGGLQIPFFGQTGGSSIQAAQDLLGRILQQQSL